MAQIYTALLKLYDNDAGGYYDPRFSIHAANKEKALVKAQKWAEYHGLSYSNVKVRIATESEKTSWVHDEYVD